MNYVLIFLLLLPVKLLMKLGRKKQKRNLVIQTAKIGDFINITPLLAHLKHSDALLSRAVAPLAKHDAMLEEIFYVEDYKTSLVTKLKLAFKLMNRYENVYLLHPNNINLFYAACCNADNKQFLSMYRRRGYQGIFYLTATGIVEHKRNTLTLENYLRLADRSLTKESYPKHATYPLLQPENSPEELFRTDRIKIGLSISAGNQAKTIPPAIWKTFFDRLSDLPCLFYVFGSPNELTHLIELNKVVGERDNLVNMIGKVSLEGLPSAISQMDFYVASDSGNVYIADSQNVPTILIYGPCCVEEQRPLGDVLLIGPDHIAPTSYVFQALYKFHHPAEQLFALDQRKLDDIHHFICVRSPQFVAEKKILS
ncbi:glycosyltransferase family 9 protein [Pantoea sp. BAV 3049]|uniref:glycosyltransferase family 9 protein n=1 Tax=Pantoea sp. BAV 3049 TaxID=2654188 RepID=UPI00131B9969|nr:glycosyltransferase family 9 protein [Pantoea sp. BAV 3049]